MTRDLAWIVIVISTFHLCGATRASSEAGTCASLLDEVINATSMASEIQLHSDDFQYTQGAGGIITIGVLQGGHVFASRSESAEHPNRLGLWPNSVSPQVDAAGNQNRVSAFDAAAAAVSVFKSSQGVRYGSKTMSNIGPSASEVTSEDQAIKEHSLKRVIRRNAFHVPRSSLLDLNGTRGVWDDPNTCGRTWNDVYDTVGEAIGSGAFGLVWKAVLKENRSREFALKEVGVDDKYATPKEWMVQNEVAVGQLEEPFVMGFHDVFIDGQHKQMRVAMPLMKGGDLFDDLQTDAFCRMAQIALGLWSMHKKFVIYGDVKSENVLLTERKVDATVGLTDFGLSSVCSAENIACGQEYAGTAGYMALSIGKQIFPYGVEVDWWSYGCLVHEMHIGHLPYGPYNKEHDRTYGRRINKCLEHDQCEYRSDRKWKNLPGDLQDLIDKTIYPSKWLSLAYNRKELVKGWDDIMLHPIMSHRFWLSNHNKELLRRLSLRPKKSSKVTKVTLQEFWGKLCQKYATNKCFCPEGYQDGCDPAERNPCAPKIPKPSCKSECNE